MACLLKNKWLWIALILVVIIIAGFVIVRGQQAAEAERQQAVAATPVSPYAAIANGRADVEGGVIQVAARRGGVVSAVYVNEGDIVTAGQILARQEDAEARLAVQRATAEVRQAESALATIRVDLSTAQREFERMNQLAASNYIAAQRLDQARDAISMAEARLASQQAAVQTARARLNEAQYNLELTIIRAPMSGRIARRYAQPGSGASTLNVSTMFDLEPDTARIVRAEIVEADIPNISVGQQVEITPEGNPDQIHVGQVLRRAGVFGARRLQSDDPSQRADERVVEVVVSAEGAPFLIGQRVLVKFMKPGEQAGAPRASGAGVGPDQAMRTQRRAS
ncbi:MAG: HlyD family secretion protein [Brevundimonas sp.]|jgi:HlyD family secretion protein|uniref:HlyD family secretion protein n=1 Tax=Brevundimonas sp. TaxID=1871086 RepID=UPI00391D8104